MRATKRIFITVTVPFSGYMRFNTIEEIEIYDLSYKYKLMKISRIHRVLILFVLSLFSLPAAAVTTVNSTGVPSGAVQSQIHTAVTTRIPTFVPPVNVSQNVGFVPLWLIIGIILIIIALSGLLWRYFHPKYVPREEKE